MNSRRSTPVVVSAVLVMSLWRLPPSDAAWGRVEKHYATLGDGSMDIGLRSGECRVMVVHPEDADHQWRKILPRHGRASAKPRKFMNSARAHQLREKRYAVVQHANRHDGPQHPAIGSGGSGTVLSAGADGSVPGRPAIRAGLGRY